MVYDVQALPRLACLAAARHSRQTMSLIYREP